ncbi:MAG: hypothetical protein WD181_00065 [Solirubrobacterales bacterium]
MEPAQIAADPTNMVKPGAPGDGLIFNPNTWSAPYLDAADEQKLKAMIEWFEDRGKQTLKDHDRENRWYSDFLEMQAEQGIFADFLTPEPEGNGIRPDDGTPSGSVPSTRSPPFTDSPTGTRGR